MTQRTAIQQTHKAAIELKRLGEVKKVCAQMGATMEDTAIYLESGFTAQQVADKLRLRAHYGF